MSVFKFSHEDSLTFLYHFGQSEMIINERFQGGHRIKSFPLRSKQHKNIYVIYLIESCNKLKVTEEDILYINYITKYNIFL